MSTFDICEELSIFKIVSQTLIDITNEIVNNIPKKQKFKNIYYQVAKWYMYNLGVDCDRKIPMMFKTYVIDELRTDILNTTQYDMESSPELLETIAKHVKSCNEQIRSVQKQSHCNYEIRNIDNRLVYVPDDPERNRYHVNINEKLHQKLIDTYEGPKDQIDEHIFALLLRYTLYGSKKSTISLSVNFVYDNPKVLNKVKLEVELFGSPVNRNLERFCSLFPDIEQHWGSIGSFFCLSDEYFKKYRYFVSNPPYTNTVMAESSQKIVDILDRIEECCFIVTIPDWRPEAGLEGGKYSDVPYEAYDILKASPHLKIDRSYSGNFTYTDYFKSKDYTIGSTGTIIMVLSNFDIPLEHSDFDLE